MTGKVKLKAFHNTPYAVEREFNEWIDEMNENGNIIIHSTHQCYLNDQNGGHIAFSVLYEYYPVETQSGEKE